ncbi:hypothetical protein B0H13DRAFT_898700 [Mycena leptocephala]|nr:hypothetical protein B0H13DRAFT_898700 [Mycena leptocephala]
MDLDIGHSDVLEHRIGDLHSEILKILDDSERASAWRLVLHRRVIAPDRHPKRSSPLASRSSRPSSVPPICSQVRLVFRPAPNKSRRATANAHPPILPTPTRVGRIRENKNKNKNKNKNENKKNKNKNKTKSNKKGTASSRGQMGTWVSGTVEAGERRAEVGWADRWGEGVGRERVGGQVGRRSRWREKGWGERNGCRRGSGRREKGSGRMEKEEGGSMTDAPAPRAQAQFRALSSKPKPNFVP